MTARLFDATPASRELRVAVLHNYREDQQPSMRLYADRLGAALARRGVQVSRVWSPDVVPEVWRARRPFWNKLDAYIGRFAVYPRLVRSLDADVIHVADHGQGYLVGNLDARRTIVTCHDVILLALAAGRIGSMPLPTIALQLLRISLEAMKRAAMVIAVSSQTKRDLIALVGMDSDKITVIPSGLNFAFRPDPAKGRATRERLNLGEGPVVLQIGRSFYKNLPAVLRVLRNLRKDGLDVRVARVGPRLAGTDRELAERLGVLGSVIELGMVSDDRLRDVYNAVDVLLFPSLYEGFGWPPVEAMACGVPVVCSRAGSLDEVVADAALTADPDDVDGLTWHVAAVLTDSSLRQALIARGLKRAAQFSWDRTAAQMIEIYRTVLGRVR
jgi:glycosyltransferase involved in cell wall biosynthesis